MSTEITDSRQLSAARVLHKRAQVKAYPVTKVLHDQAARFTVNNEGEDEQEYYVRGGEPIWLNVATDSTFYVTLEDQGVQLTFIVVGDSVLLTKKRLRYGDAGTVSAHVRHSVSLSSSGS